MVNQHMKMRHSIQNTDKTVRLSCSKIYNPKRLGFSETEVD